MKYLCKCVLFMSVYFFSMDNSDISAAPVNESLEAIKKLKVEELKKILRDRGQPVTGKKADLVLRCQVLFEREKTQTNAVSEQENAPLLVVTASKKNASDITYESLVAETVDCVWATDLRGLPPFNFVQLYDYLVIKTAKYDHASIRSSGYKKLKAFQFFKEGHIRKTHIGAKGGITYVKAEVLASMKQKKYKVMVSMSHFGEVLKAACQCPAGRGVNGLGQCNHVGGILFAVEDFCRRGLKEHEEPVSCTSRLCSWNAPRNVQVDPKPVNDIVITKYRFGKETDQRAQSSLYDPRAPADRQVNPEALSKLSDELSTCLQSSCYFLFHDVTPKPTADENVQVDCICETVPESAPDIVTEKNTPDLPFNDDYDISSAHFKSMMDCFAETQSISDVDIETVERVTRGQSNNEVWRQLKRDKLTASNFHNAAVRRKEPDKLLKNIMYISEKKKSIASLEYGQLHESDAVASYVAAKAAEGNTLLRVEEVGTTLSKERPGYGASLDRKVYDPKAPGMKVGGLEVKCPYCKRGMTVEQACKDPNFCLYIDDDGVPKLKFGHKYYYQVQGQMYVCNLEWVDFVVWFGGNNVFIQRIHFNREWWYQTVLPRLDYFYNRAFLPEIFTRRIERGVKLYNHGGWKSFQK